MITVIPKLLVWAATLMMSVNNVVFAPEICDNGIDDDGDGLIDLNDPDCKCKGIKDSVYVPTSLIPNPSFELYTRCPDDVAQLDRSVGWIQASPATSDYYNLCGYRDDVLRGRPPQPLPAGRGYVGFLDVRNSPGRGIYKEYVGACLTSPMKVGKEYTLTYWIGFGTRGTLFGPRQTFNMGIYGTSDCKYLPFGYNPIGYLCPTNYAGWFELTRITVSGRNQWKKVVVKLRPTVDVAAVVLGPSCANTDGDYYFWMDELILEETVKFDSLSIDVAGNPCVDTILLSSSKSTKIPIAYQWYKDGIAIPGAISDKFAIPKGALGKYVLRASYKNECDLSKTFDYNIDRFVTEFNRDICLGDSAVVSNKVYKSAGTYYDTLKNKDGCDSILQINLTLHPHYADTIQAVTCANFPFDFDGQSLDSTAVYEFRYFTSQSCDSIVYLNLKVNPVDRADISASICKGDFIEVEGKKYDQSGDFEDTIQNEFGCDSILNIHLKVMPISLTQIDSAICLGNFVAVGTKRYIQSGFYLDTLASVGNCDSIVQLNLLVNKNDTVRIDTQFCQNSSITILGKKYDQSGFYSIKGINQKNCDSVINLNLLIHPNYNQSISREICSLDSVIIANQIFKATGLYTINLQSLQGCDSTIVLDLKVNPIKMNRVDTSICFGDVLVYNGRSYNQSGLYSINEKTSKNCDSIIVLNLTVNTPLRVLDSIKDSRCYNDFNGEVYLNVSGGKAPYHFEWNTFDTTSSIKELEPGIFTVTVTDQMGCEEIKSFNISEPPCFCFKISSENGDCITGNKNRIFINQINGRPVDRILLNGNIQQNITNVINGVSDGKIIIELFDSLGCQYTDSVEVKFDHSFETDLNEDTLYVTVGDSVDLKLPGHFNNRLIDVLWEGPQIILCDTCPSTKIIATAGQTEYSFKGYDESGCSVVYRIIINAKQGFWVPNVFSPNGDEVNDYFNLISDSSIGQIDLLQIFDRWGERIFESKAGIPNSSNGAWKGDFNGRPVNSGVYVYLFQFKDKAGKAFQLHGDVTLVR